MYWEILSPWVSLVAQLAKKPPAIQETWVQSLGWEDPLEKGAAARSSILAWRIRWTEEPSRLQSMGWQRVGHERTTFTFIFPLHYCLESYNFHNKLETYLRTRNHLLHHLWFQLHLQYFPGQILESEAEYFFPFVHLNSKHLKSNK